MGNNASNAASVARKHWSNQAILKYSEKRIVQNFIIVWLDLKIKHSDSEYQYALHQLKQVIHSVTTFVDQKKCQEFIETIHTEQILLIVSGSAGEKFVPIIQDNRRIDWIYVFCGDVSRQKWTKSCKKIKRVTTAIEEICSSIVDEVADCSEDFTPTGIIPANNSAQQNLALLDQSFIYSLLLKDILLDIQYRDDAISLFADFCRSIYSESEKESNIINELETSYFEKAPVWWYTRESFIYDLLNRSLRVLDYEAVTSMGFLIKDMHEQIEALHKEQKPGFPNPLVVFRGQRMFQEDFESMQKNIGGLLTFNCFLSTSKDRDKALAFTERGEDQSNKVRLLFRITIDPTKASVPFADIGQFSRHRREQEILFSTHTTFRIVSIRNNRGKSDEVELESLNDNDLQRTRLIQQIKRELGTNDDRDRLARLMIQIEQFTKAEEIYRELLKCTQSTNGKARARIYSQLAFIKYKQHQFAEAQKFCTDAIAIQENLRPHDDLRLADSYTNMAFIYTSKRDDPNAHIYHQKALEIREKRLDENHPDLATTYNNIGLVYDQSGDYHHAIEYYQKTLDIYKQTLESNHPWIATTCKSIGLAQISSNEQKKGFYNLHHALAIRKASLPSNHSSITSLCTDIGTAYRLMKDYSNALKHYQEVLNIEKRRQPPNNYQLATAYYNISRTYQGMQEHEAALEYAQNAWETAKNIAQTKHPDLTKFREHFQGLRDEQ